MSALSTKRSTKPEPPPRAHRVAGVVLEAFRRGGAVVGGPAHAGRRRPPPREGLLLRPPRPAPAALRHRRDAGPPRRGWSRGSTRRSSSPSATASTTRAARRACRPRDRDALRALQRGRDFVWIAGNHDPDAPAWPRRHARRRARDRADRSSATSRIRDRRAARSPGTSIPRRAWSGAASRCRREMLRRRRSSPRVAVLRRLCRRAQRARPRLRRAVRDGDLPGLHARRRPGLPGRPARAQAGLKTCDAGNVVKRQSGRDGRRCSRSQLTFSMSGSTHVLSKSGLSGP